MSDSTNVASEPPSDVPEQDNKPKDDFSFLDAWNFHVGNFNIAFNRAVGQITNGDFGVDFLPQKEGYRQKGDYFNYFLCDVNCILEGTIDYLAIYGLAEAAGWLVTNATVFLSKSNGTLTQVSTGRTQAANLTEQLAMEQAMSNPATGKTLPIIMTDERWLAEDGWIKMFQNINGIEIHYLLNKITGAVADFKFK